MASTRQYAGIGRRFVAYLLDGLVVSAAAIPGFILLFIGGLMTSSRDSSDLAGVLIVIGYLVLMIGCLAMFIYNISLLGRDGATLGKRWMKMKVLDPSGNPLGFGKAFLREIVKGLLANICGILLLWPLWDQEKQGLYDKMFSTHVYDA